MFRPILQSLLLLGACKASEEPDDDADPEVSALCRAIEGRYCHEACTSVVIHCSWEEYEVTTDSCPDECNARSQLLIALCDDGVDEDIEVIEAEMVCEEVDTV